MMFMFENGIIFLLENVVVVKVDMIGVVDGFFYYVKFCNLDGGNIIIIRESLVDEVGDGEIVVIGYLKFVIIIQDGVVFGYFFEGDGFEDVVVIVVFFFEF